MSGSRSTPARLTAGRQQVENQLEWESLPVDTLFLSARDSLFRAILRAFFIPASIVVAVRTTGSTSSSPPKRRAGPGSRRSGATGR